MRCEDRKVMMHNVGKNRKLFSLTIFIVVFLAAFTSMIIIIPNTVKAATAYLYTELDGGTNSWSLAPGPPPTEHYPRVGEGSDDGDNSYVYDASCINSLEEFEHQDRAFGGASISNLRVIVSARKTTLNDLRLNIGIYNGLNPRQPGTTKDLSTDWASYVQDFPTNPFNGDSPWTEADIINLQSSLQSIWPGVVPGEIRVTYVCFEVTYSANNPPSVTGISGAAPWHDSNNCYTMNGWYILQTEFNDNDGAEDFDYVQLSIAEDLTGEGEPSPDTTFMYEELSGLFTHPVQGDWDFDEVNSSDGKDGNTLTINWVFRPQWDCAQTTDLDIKLYCVDEDAAEDELVIEDEFNVVSALAIYDITATDSRVNAGGTTTVDFDIHYAIDSACSGPSETENPPDGEITSVTIYDSKGTAVSDPQTSITNGAGSAIITANSTVFGSHSYHLYINMANTTNSEPPNTDVQIISDRINVSWKSDQYSFDEGTEVNISLDSVSYGSDSNLVSSYQYDYEIERAGVTYSSFSGNTTGSFAFNPGIFGWYYINLTAVQDVGGYGITSYQQNDTILIKVKQNISLVKNSNNNGINYITWGATSSITAGELAGYAGLIENDTITMFNTSSGAWDIGYTYPEGPLNFTINRWDYVKIHCANAKSFSIEPDAPSFTNQNKALVHNNDNNGYNYITWTKTSSIKASNLATDSDLDLTNQPISVYNPTTGKWRGYTEIPGLPQVIKDGMDFYIQPYDVICLKITSSTDGSYFNIDNY